MDDRQKGTVKWFNDAKGYGFIQRVDGKDVFVHYSSIRGEGHRTLLEGQMVEFDVSNGDKGPLADDVSVTEQRRQTKKSQLKAGFFMF